MYLHWEGCVIATMTIEIYLLIFSIMNLKYVIYKNSSKHFYHSCVNNLNMFILSIVFELGCYPLIFTEISLTV